MKKNKIIAVALIGLLMAGGLSLAGCGNKCGQEADGSCTGTGCEDASKCSYYNSGGGKKCNC